MALQSESKGTQTDDDVRNARSVMILVSVVLKCHFHGIEIAALDAKLHHLGDSTSAVSLRPVHAVERVSDASGFERREKEDTRSISMGDRRTRTNDRESAGGSIVRR